MQMFHSLGARSWGSAPSSSRFSSGISKPQGFGSMVSPSVLKWNVSSSPWQKKIFLSTTRSRLPTMVLSRNPTEILFRRNYQSGENSETRHLPTLPFGVWGSLLKPALFCILLGGAVLLLVNSDQGREYSRNRLISIHKKRQQDPEDWWYMMDDSKKTLFAFAALNGVIFLMWNVPVLAPKMFAYFSSSTVQHSTLPLLTSSFSHSTGMHFLFNMVAIWSFGTNLHNAVGREQTAAIFLCGALSASLSSHYYRLFRREFFTFSLGASGGAYALVIASITLFPDAKLSFIFLPFVPISASLLIPIMVSIDAIGLTGVWRRMFALNWDHAGHLGGAAFGYVYINWLVERAKRRRALSQGYIPRK